MHLTAEIYREDEWFAAFCPEVPEANGEGRTEADAIDSLRAGIELVFASRRGARRSVNSSPRIYYFEVHDQDSVDAAIIEERRGEPFSPLEACFRKWQKEESVGEEKPPTAPR